MNAHRLPKYSVREKCAKSHIQSQLRIARQIVLKLIRWFIVGLEINRHQSNIYNVPITK